MGPRHRVAGAGRDPCRTTGGGDRTARALAVARHGESLLPERRGRGARGHASFRRGTRRSWTWLAARALRRRQADEAVTLSLDRLRVLERMGRFDEAVDEARELRESLRAGRGEGALDFLVASTSYLRLLRRSGQMASKEYEQGANEAAAVAEDLEFRELSSRPGLVRELLAEIGNRSAKLLELGIETVGVARGSSKRLDEQLDKVDRSIATPRTATIAAGAADAGCDRQTGVEVRPDRSVSTTTCRRRSPTPTATRPTDSTPDYQSRSLAILAPSTSASSLAHMIVGWTRRTYGPWANPQSVPADHVLAPDQLRPAGPVVPPPARDARRRWWCGRSRPGSAPCRPGNRSSSHTRHSWSCRGLAISIA